MAYNLLMRKFPKELVGVISNYMMPSKEEMKAKKQLVIEELKDCFVTYYEYESVRWFWEENPRRILNLERFFSEYDRKEHQRLLQQGFYDHPFHE